MASIQQLISEKFIDKLSNASNETDAAKVEKLQALFTAGNKIKADDLVKIFSFSPEPEIK